eukprot:3727191-Alexandrium_andersonii.AAC.1
MPRARRAPSDGNAGALMARPRCAPGEAGTARAPGGAAAQSLRRGIQALGAGRRHGLRFSVGATA